MYLLSLAQNEVLPQQKPELRQKTHYVQRRGVAMATATRFTPAKGEKDRLVKERGVEGHAFRAIIRTSPSVINRASSLTP